MNKKIWNSPKLEPIKIQTIALNAGDGVDQNQQTNPNNSYDILQSSFINANQKEFKDGGG